MNGSKQDKVFICRCEEVTQEEIEEAIRDDATTLTGIKKRTHAGMGLCQGRTCRPLIAELLREKNLRIKFFHPRFDLRCGRQRFKNFWRMTKS